MTTLKIDSSNIDKLPAPLISRWREKLEAPLYIDMSANAFDLRPAAYAIANRIEGLKTLSPDAPFMVPMGEHHDVVTTQLVQSAVMCELQQRGFKISAAAELNHLNYDKYLRVLGLNFTRLSFINIQKLDIDNELLLQAALGIVEVQSHAQNFLFCRENGIPLSFVDAAHTYVADEDDEDKAYLDYSDCKTKMAALSSGYMIDGAHLDDALDDENVNPDDIDLIDQSGHDAVSPTGFHVRNKVMVVNMLENFNKQKPDIFVLGTGGVHVMGGRATKINFTTPYAHSLTKIFRDKACVVAPCGLVTQNLDLPADVDKTSLIQMQGLGYANKFTDDEAIRLCAEFSGGLIKYYEPLTNEDREAYRENIGTVVEKVVAASCKP